MRGRIYRRLVWCWAWCAYWLWMTWPRALGAKPYGRFLMWLLPWAGMWAYSESYADFCDCPMFNGGKRA